MDTENWISFPPGALADEPVRLTLAANAPDWFAVNKPAGLNAFSDSRAGGGPRCIVQAVRDRIGQGRFAELGLCGIWPVNLPERDLSGVFLCAKSEAERTRLKNALGSLQIRFQYHFLAEGGGEAGELECNLPLAFHHADMRSFVTHRSGKKTVTRFRCLERNGRWSLWESESGYDRFHQVRVHAAECGLAICGETAYEPPATGRRKGRPVRSIPGDVRHQGPPLALHLRRLLFPDSSGEITAVEADYPPTLRAMMEKPSDP